MRKHRDRVENGEDMVAVGKKKNTAFAVPRNGVDV